MICPELLKVLDSPWVVSTSDKVSESGDGFSFELLDGSPQHIRKQFEEVKQLHEWEMSNRKEWHTFDDAPFEAYLDGIAEQALVKCYESDPEKFANAVEEWESEHGRKIGKPAPEEISLRNKAWESLEKLVQTLP